MEEDGDGAEFEDQEAELENEVLEDEEGEPELEDGNAVDTGVLEDNEISMLAAGLASQDESEILAALEGMMKAVTGSEGERVLVTYVSASAHCVEVMSAWQRGPAARTAVSTMLLLYQMFLHPLSNKSRRAADSKDGQSGDRSAAAEEHRKRLVTARLRLDKVARSIVRTRMKDIYAHLTSNWKSRQNAALLLLSSIVLRGKALATEIATSFDFTLEAMRKLGQPPKPKRGDAAPDRGGHKGGILNRPTRAAFLEFAISFLIIGDPGLLRWVLQKRPLWAGVLHKLSKDDKGTIIRVLTMIQGKIMTRDSLVPPGLQSVLFGDVTLEQLTRISSDGSLEEAGEVAHAILLSLCTDSSHGLCPVKADSWESAASAAAATTPGSGSGDKSGGEIGVGGGGGQRRLLRLSLRLKVTEVKNHRDLLLAIARNRPVLATMYLASIPLSLEPRVSPAWFNAMSIVAELIPIASRYSMSISALAYKGLAPPKTDSPLLQYLFLGLLPSSLSRGVLNRGLLHVDLVVKHACLRVLSESLFCLQQVTQSIKNALLGDCGSVDSTKHSAGLPSLKLDNDDDDKNDSSFLQNDWMDLSEYIQDTMRATLPDPSTLSALLSLARASQNSVGPDLSASKLKKRKRERAKLNNEGDELNTDAYNKDDVLVQLWGREAIRDTPKNGRIEKLLHAKVMQVLAACQLALPNAMEDAGFDVFKALQDDAASLSVAQQRSLAALLSAATGSSISGEKSRASIRGSGFSSSMMKTFKQLLQFMLDSNVGSVKDELYEVVHQVMASSGAFHRNSKEISLWLNPLSTWKVDRSQGEQGDVFEFVKSQLPAGPLRAGIVDFLSNAVSGIGHDIYKALDLLHSILAESTLQHGDPERSGVNLAEFGPFVICAIENCVQSLRSKGKTDTERFAMTLYVANVLKLLLTYQVWPQPLAAVLHSLLSNLNTLSIEERANNAGWIPLLAVLHEAQSVLHASSDDSHCQKDSKQSRSFSSFASETHGTQNFSDVLTACREVDDLNDKQLQLMSCLISVSVQELVENFPLLMTICLVDLEGDFSLVTAILGIYSDLFSEVSRAWPDLFLTGMELAANAADNKGFSLAKAGSKNAFTVYTHLGPPLCPEVIGFSVLLLSSPFSMLLLSATNWKSDLDSGPRAYSYVLLDSLRRLEGRDVICAVRCIISGMKRVLSVSSEVGLVESHLEMCFVLIRSLVLPVPLQSNNPAPSSSKQEQRLTSCPAGSSEEVMIDLLAHPEFYDLFLNTELKFHSLAAPCPCVDGLRRDTKDQTLCDTSLRRVLDSAASMTMLHPVDSHILGLIVKFMKLPSKVPAGSEATAVRASGTSLDVETIRRACKPYILKAVSTFHAEVIRGLEHGIAPSTALFAISVLIRYARPRVLFGIFSLLLSAEAVKVKSSKKLAESSSAAPHLLGLHLVTVLWNSISSTLPSCTDDEGDDRDTSWLWERTSDDAEISVEDLFSRVIQHVTKSPSVTADLCLLSFLCTSNLRHLACRRFEGIRSRFIQISSDLAQFVPLEVLRHCVSQPNKVTGKIISMLVQMSAVHRAAFGQLLASGTGNVDSNVFHGCGIDLPKTLLLQNLWNVKVDFLFDRDLLALLPAAQVYVTLLTRNVGENNNEAAAAKHIASVYAKMLTEQLGDWDAFVSAGHAIDGGDDDRAVEGEHLYDQNQVFLWFEESFLGRVSKMLQTCSDLHPLSVECRARLMQSLLLKDNQPFVTQKVLLSAGADLRRIIFEAVARAQLIGYIVASGREKEVAEERLQTQLMSENEADQKQTFLWSLARTLSTLYRTEALLGDDQTNAAVESQIDTAKRRTLLKFLEEVYLFRLISVVKEPAQCSSDIVKYMPLYSFAMKTLLGFRYGEKLPMKASRYLTFVLYQNLQRLSVDLPVDGDMLDLLIAHSQFLPTLLAVGTKQSHLPSVFEKHVSKGAALHSLSSVLSIVRSPGGAERFTSRAQVKVRRMRSVTFSDMKGRNGLEGRTVEDHEDGDDDLKTRGRLEFVKLLRVLVAVRLKQINAQLSFGSGSVPLSEILAILLAAYGGTMSTLDQELLQLMNELQRFGGLGFSGLAELDYLWGKEAALQRRNMLSGASNNVAKTQVGLDSALRKDLFKEHLMIDPRRCGLTVLFFPLKRSFADGRLDLSEILNEYDGSAQGDSSVCVDDADKDFQAAAYDPAFLLKFASHALSSSLLTAEEFVRLGLLAVTFASVSSAEESMRKAGYDILAIYFNILQDGPSFKGRPQIQSLMNYMKNSVVEPWQRIPAVFTTFAAEASCILMHPENNNYMIVNRHLLRSPSLDFESVPLFQAMFGSGSIQHRSDRLWMLRLVAAGLRTSLDARVYRRKFVLEILMSFYGTNMADTLSRKWILQILYEAAGIRSCAQYLVVHTGFFSWLAFVAANDLEDTLESETDAPRGQLASMCLQVMERVMSWRTVQRYFHQDCMEELSRVGHICYRLLFSTSAAELQKDFRKFSLSVLLKLVQISQKRKTHQTQFTLSLGAMLEILDFVERQSVPEAEPSDAKDTNTVFQLLLYVPPSTVYSATNRASLLKAANWALSAGLGQTSITFSKERSLGNDWSYGVDSSSQVTESPLEKLLRWLSASIIRGEIAQRAGIKNEQTRETFVSSWLVVEYFQGTVLAEDSSRPEVNDALARLLLALESYVSERATCTSLVPVVVAVALLLAGRLSSADSAGTRHNIQGALRVLLSDLPCADEVDPLWQWSVKGRWTRQESHATSAEELAIRAQYSLQICRTLLIFYHQLLSKRPSQYSSFLSKWQGILSQKDQFARSTDSDLIGKLVREKLGQVRGRLLDVLLDVGDLAHTTENRT